VIKSTAAPKITDKHLAFIPYVYALALTAIITWQLFVLQKYVAYIGDLIDVPTDWVPSSLASVLIGFEIFSLPFLLRLKLSKLARLCSASLAFLTPIVWTFITMFNDNFSVGLLFVDIGSIIWAALSVWILGGQKIFSVKGE